MCIQKHLHGEFRTELRDSQRAQRTAVYLFRGHPQCIGILEQAHYLGIVQRDLGRIDAR